MKIITTCGIALFFFSCAFSLSASDVYEKVQSSTFRIYAFDIKDKKPVNVSQGSAVAITSNLLVSNCHVIKNSEYITLDITKEVKRAFLTYGNEKLDLCLIFIPEISLVPVSVSNSTILKPGQIVYAISSPQGYKNIITQGIIAGMESTDGATRINIDVNIKAGSSGGGLFDEDAKLIGITSGTKNDIAYAIPASWINEVIPALKKSARQPAKTLEKDRLAKDRQVQKNLSPIKIAEFGIDNLELYKYGQTCFIGIYGRDLNNKIVSRAIWFPVIPDYIFFAKVAKPLTYVINDIVELDNSTSIITSPNQSYINFDAIIFPLILAKDKYQQQFVLLAKLPYSLIPSLKKAKHFSAYFIKNQRIKTIDYGLFGFTDAYIAYINKCKTDR
jgi:hypothetical protein